MSVYRVTITFLIDGSQKDAIKVAARAEAVIDKSKRLVEAENGSLMSTVIEPEATR